MVRSVIFFTLVFFTVSPGSAFAEKRVALVIGNGAYQDVDKLPNPTRDAEAIADLFKKAGFDVVQAQNNLRYLDFMRALRDFENEAQVADIAVVFYAGYATALSGENYMIPVDAKIAKEKDVEDQAVSLERIVRAVKPAKRLRLVILDAPRDSPFQTEMQPRSAERPDGLAKVNEACLSENTLIVYATSAGSVAFDGDGDHSPFTSALLKHLAEPGLDIRIALMNVSDEVRRSTQYNQEPFVCGMVGGKTISLMPKGSSLPEERAQPEAEAKRKAAEQTQKEAERQKAESEGKARAAAEAARLKSAEAAEGCETLKEKREPPECAVCKPGYQISSTGACMRLGDFGASGARSPAR